MGKKEDKGCGGNCCNKDNSDKGKNKPLCKKVKFTLVVTLNFDNKTSKKLKTHFNSKPDVGGCNLPDKIDFIKAYRKLIKKYRESLPKDTLSKSTSPQVVSTNSQISSTFVPEDGCGDGQCKCKGGEYACGVTCNKKSGASECAWTEPHSKCVCKYKNPF